MLARKIADFPLSFALIILVASTGVNVLTFYRLSSLRTHCESETSKIIDDSRFTYVGEDHPNQLPVELGPVALEIEDTLRYGVSSRGAWADWRSTDYFPKANGFVKLGPNHRMFGISMFHQMHCLQKMRESVLQGRKATYHTHHCFNFLRQAILCASDTTLDPIDKQIGGGGADGIGTVHVCRDWEKVYDFVYENQRSLAWNNTTR